MKTFNKRGDKGETSLLYGGRVAKDNLRCEAYGTIDEAVSALGLARNLARKDRTKAIILTMQKELFMVGAELATELSGYEEFSSRFTPISARMVDAVESLINELESEIEMPHAFVIPGGNSGSAALDLARSITRRAERRAVSLRGAEEIKNEFVLSYLNRTADLLFTLARYEET